MNKVWQDDAWDDYLYWQKQDRRKLNKINDLIKSIEREGVLAGAGKPEALKGELAGLFSRRIDSKNRIVYRIRDGNLEIIQCGSHYRDK